MNESTRKLKAIHDYCKSHKIGSSFCDCVLERNCIQTKKRMRYNDPRFVDKCYNKVERALTKELKEIENDPFAEFED